MDENQREKFYVRAALFLNLDGNKVDVTLAKCGLSARLNTPEKCQAALKAAYPERYRSGRTAYPEGEPK